jgi:hypothetical protein
MVPLSLIFFNVPVNSCAIAGVMMSAVDSSAALTFDSRLRFIMSGNPRFGVEPNGWCCCSMSNRKPGRSRLKSEVLPTQNALDTFH